ncbi:MAG: ParB/RepB/Spo0J family partition protein [Clostridiales bacterium]|nr:ParB/RepB/Spo0J family partition protein [Clostridiales bacterium]
MAKKPAGLGRGIENIFIDNEIDSENRISSLRVSQLEPRSDQPRKTFDAESLASLADSIAVHGVLQPILVREAEGGYYQIVAGERRWRAAKMAGLTEIPVIVTEGDDKHAAQCAIVENVQREDLNPVEEAFAYKSLIEDHNMTQEQVSAVIGKSRSAVANSLRLLDLPEGALSMLAAGKFTAGHARALLSLKRKEDIMPLAEKIYESEMSVRMVEAAAASLNKQAERESENAADEGEIKIDYYADIERRLMDAFGRRVKISRKRIEISFEDNDDLQVLLTRLMGEAVLES